MGKKIKQAFFERPVDIVAEDLIGKVICRSLDKKEFRAKIVETEAYFGEDDPASWARFGKRKDNFAMWLSGGVVLVKNVHKYFMLNFVTGNEGEAGAVLIRAVEPLNFEGRTAGPGLLSKELKIGKEFNAKSLFEDIDLSLEEGDTKRLPIKKSYRIGVKKDLKKKLRYYLEENKFVSKKNGKRKFN